jgi:hypothetical protein
MGQFGIETRQWLMNLIKQRKFLVRNNLNHKPQHELNKALFALETQLGAYTYENDLYMARFIRQYRNKIETIVPGSGATCHTKRMRELAQINKKAITILEHNPPSLRQAQGFPPIGGMKSTHINQKSLQYEMEF